MKARHFKRLRKKLGKIQVYKIRESASMFGDFFGYNRICLVMDDHKVSATSPKRAVKIFFRQYKKERKQDHERAFLDLVETSEKWGHIMVVDEKGFKTFY